VREQGARLAQHDENFPHHAALAPSASTQRTLMLDRGAGLEPQKIRPNEPVKRIRHAFQAKLPPATKLTKPWNGEHRATRPPNEASSSSTSSSAGNTTPLPEREPPLPHQHRRQPVRDQPERRPLRHARSDRRPARATQLGEARLEPHAGHPHAQEPEVGALDRLDPRGRQPACAVDACARGRRRRRRNSVGALLASRPGLSGDLPLGSPNAPRRASA